MYSPTAIARRRCSTCAPAPGLESFLPERIDEFWARAHSTFQYATGAGGPSRHRLGVVEWQVTDTGWVQVTVDAGRAGSAQLNLAVDDLTATKGEISGRGLSSGDTQPVSKGVELSSLSDPDGNVVTLIGSFRVRY